MGCKLAITAEKEMSMDEILGRTSSNHRGSIVADRSRGIAPPGLSAPGYLDLR